MRFRPRVHGRATLVVSLLEFGILNCDTSWKPSCSSQILMRDSHDRVLSTWDLEYTSTRHRRVSAEWNSTDIQFSVHIVSTTNLQTVCHVSFIDSGLNIESTTSGSTNSLGWGGAVLKRNLFFSRPACHLSQFCFSFTHAHKSPLKREQMDQFLRLPAIFQRLPPSPSRHLPPTATLPPRHLQPSASQSCLQPKIVADLIYSKPFIPHWPLFSSCGSFPSPPNRTLLTFHCPAEYSDLSARNSANLSWWASSRLQKHTVSKWVSKYVVIMSSRTSPRCQDCSRTDFKSLVLGVESLV